MDFSQIPPDIDLSKIPSYPPPPGVVSNFINPPSLATTTIVTSSVMVGVMVICVAARMYAKACVTHTVGWDDYTCLIASMGSIAYLGLLVKVYTSGFGPHQWDLPITKLTPQILKLFNVIGIFPPTLLFCTKLSLLLFYLRLFAINRLVKNLIYINIFFNFSLYTSNLFLSIYLCPLTGPSYYICRDKSTTLAVAVCSIGIFSDFCILLLPFLATSQLPLTPKKRLGVVAIFFTGFLACLAGIIGLIYRIRLNGSPDFTWNLTPVLILSVIELNIGVIVSCLPTLPSIFRGSSSSRFKSYHPQRFSFIRQENSNSQGSSGTYKQSSPTFSLEGPKLKYFESSDNTTLV